MKWGIENDTCMILAWLSPVKCREQKDATGINVWGKVSTYNFPLVE
jgi:hypothetical protein